MEISLGFPQENKVFQRPCRSVLLVNYYDRSIFSMAGSLGKPSLVGERQFERHSKRRSMRLLNALNSEDRGVKVRFSLATIAFDRESAQMSQILSSQGKNAPSDPYPHYLVRLATSRISPRTLSY